MTGVKRTDWPEIEAAWKRGDSVRQILATFADLSPWTLSSHVRLKGLPKRHDYAQRRLRVCRPGKWQTSTSPWRRKA